MVEALISDVCLKHIIITCFTSETEVWLTPMINLSHTSVDKSGFSNRLCPCDPEKITRQDAPFTSTSFPSTEDRQMTAEWIDGQRVAVWCHVGVYLSTTTGRNTSRAQPGQGQWIWLGQAAIWMARGRGEKRDKKKSARKSTKTNMEDGAATEGSWELLLMSFYKKKRSPCLASKPWTLAPISKLLMIEDNPPIYLINPLFLVLSIISINI